MFLIEVIAKVLRSWRNNKSNGAHTPVGGLWIYFVIGLKGPGSERHLRRRQSRWRLAAERPYAGGFHERVTPVSFTGTAGCTDVLFMYNYVCVCVQPAVQRVGGDRQAVQDHRDVFTLHPVSSTTTGNVEKKTCYYLYSFRVHQSSQKHLYKEILWSTWTKPWSNIWMCFWKPSCSTLNLRGRNRINVLIKVGERLALNKLGCSLLSSLIPKERGHNCTEQTFNYEELIGKCSWIRTLPWGQRSLLRRGSLTDVEPVPTGKQWSDVLILMPVSK